MELDTERWSGDGEFTQAIVERLRLHPRIETLRVEDAPASREDTGYTFISNELFIRPVTEWHTGPGRRWIPWRSSRRVAAPAIRLPEIRQWLASAAAIGAPDFADDGMLQYLRTVRIVPPYQTRGYKLVELVRIYLVAVSPG